MLTEFCETTGYNRKYAIRWLNGPEPKKGVGKRRGRRSSYGGQEIRVVSGVWEAAGYPWSVRLKALLPVWMPWVRQHYDLDEATEAKILRMSPATMDRHLQSKKRTIRKRQYGRTRPGHLLKHQIPIKTDQWDVREPGFVEVDLVSHSGNSATGEFIHSLNMTDVHTGWVETRAVMGKGQEGIVTALEQMRQSAPFSLRGIDSDNGSEFINYHLLRYCRRRKIQFTRGRPYQKNDNAHIEQKNWTHVRRIFGYSRFDTPEALEAMNALYSRELRQYQNLFLPSTKLIEKTRVGSKLRRVYDRPRTPLERVQESGKGHRARLTRCEQVFQSVDPFQLSRTIDRKLESVFRTADGRDRRVQR